MDAHRISITFNATTLPAEVCLFGLVRPYVDKAVLCLNCIRYNLDTNNCRFEKQCTNCAQQHDGLEKGDCHNEAKCLSYCKEDPHHSTSDGQIAERQRQRIIVAITAK